MNKINKNKSNIFDIVKIKRPKKQFYSSITLEKINEEIYSESEKELGLVYEHKKELQTIFDFTDICDDEKKFFCLWNAFANANGVDSIGLNKDLVELFIVNSKETIEKLGLEENLMLFTLMLFDSKKLSRTEFEQLTDLL